MLSFNPWCHFNAIEDEINCSDLIASHCKVVCPYLDGINVICTLYKLKRIKIVLITIQFPNMFFYIYLVLTAVFIPGYYVIALKDNINDITPKTVPIRLHYTVHIFLMHEFPWDLADFNLSDLDNAFDYVVIMYSKNTSQTYKCFE